MTINAFDLAEGHRNKLSAVRTKRFVEISITYNSTATPAVVSDAPGVAAALASGVTSLTGLPIGDTSLVRCYFGLESPAGTVEQVREVTLDAAAGTLAFTTGTYDGVDSIDPTDPATGDKVHVQLSYGLAGQ